MTKTLSALFAALLCGGVFAERFPAPGWVERPDPCASPYAQPGGTLVYAGHNPPKSFNGYLDNNTFTMMVFSILYPSLLTIDPATGAIPEGIAAQTAQSLKNIQAILAEQGMTLADVVKTTVFLADMNDFAEMNKVYGEYFAQPFPARSAVQVAKLPKGAPLEIECIAVK